MSQPTEPSPEAEALARVIWNVHSPIVPSDFLAMAQEAIDAGWTPPPDPHEDIAREIWAAQADMWPVGDVWQPHRSKTQADLLDAVRRLDLRRGA